MLWSIALPGFGQMLNRQYVKGIALLAMEVIVNVQASFNRIILLSFQGRIGEALQLVDYQWLMFYPCLYFYAIWDAVKDAGGAERPYAYMPYAFSAFMVTVGLIYSSKIRIFGVLLGPVWLPMLSVVPGVAIGLAVRAMLMLLQSSRRAHT